MADKGYLTSIPSEYVTETELNNKGYATQSSLNSTNSNVSSIGNNVASLNTTVNTLNSTVSSLSSTVSSHTTSISSLSSNKLNTSDLLDKIYPVGSIYMSTKNVSPASFLGGKWNPLQDRFLIGAGSSYSVNAKSGATTVTLTTSQIPSHTHAVHEQLVGWVSSGGWLGMGSSSNFKTGLNTTYSVGATGGGSAHNNMPPYHAVYMWERVTG